MCSLENVGIFVVQAIKELTKNDWILFVKVSLLISWVSQDERRSEKGEKSCSERTTANSHEDDIMIKRRSSSGRNLISRTPSWTEHERSGPNKEYWRVLIIRT